jgi:hypothetical protein
LLARRAVAGPPRRIIMIDISAREYSAYMRFTTVEPDLWREDVLAAHMSRLGATGKVTDDDVQRIRFCSEQAPDLRLFHGLPHGAFVGQPEAPPKLLAALSPDFRAMASSILFIAGVFHDAAYKHVDEIDDRGTRAWPGVLRDLVGDYIRYDRETVDGKAVFTTHIKDRDPPDAVTSMVAHIFGVGPEGIVHNRGGNEFDSALAAAQFLREKGVPPRVIVAVVAAIAATVPFRPALDLEGASLPDGHMGELAQRVRTATLSLNGVDYQPDWPDTNDMMTLAVHLSNRDISPFTEPDNFARVVDGGRRIKAEELPELRDAVTNIEELVRAAGIERSAPFLYQGLAGGRQPVPPEHVPHLYVPRDANGRPMGIEHAYPPVHVYRAAVHYTERNTQLATLFFKSHEIGIAVAASIATLIGESRAPVPGIVRAQSWHPRAVPPQARIDAMEEGHQQVYRELMFGEQQHDIDIVTPHRSPIGGMVFGTVGMAGVNHLSQFIKGIREEAAARGQFDPFSEAATAQRYLDEIRRMVGEDVFRQITTELHRVAVFYRDDPVRGNPDRIPLLAELGGGIIRYEGATSV